MTNAEKFVHLFGLYATELWSKSEKDFLIWLNAEYENVPDTNVGELISRQAAIDNLMEILDRPNHAEFLYTDEICRALNHLPSAQPEIIHCKECKFAHMTYDGECKYCDVWFPNESEYLDGDYYCASAERKTDE